MKNAYLPHTDESRQELLDEIGVSQFEDLLEGIPKDIKKAKINIPESISEYQLEKDLKEYFKLNEGSHGYSSFLGGGVYEHFIPSIVTPLASRGEFLTAYTPYQAEASQGTLQAIYEYQTMISHLTGMDVSNASHYDGGTGMAEAVLMAIGQTRRKKVVITEAVNPDYRRVLRTYLSSFECELVEIAPDSQGQFDRVQLKEALSDEVACFVAQTPNFFGVIEDFDQVREMLDQAGALFVIVQNPLSLGVLKSPGDWGADIACGDSQPFGLPPSFGGPHLGYMASTKKLMRRIPGRLAGVTSDAEGKRAFVLTLQAREQHIRREKASSNICTNQGLCLIRSCVHLCALGEDGLKTIATLNVQNTNYLKEKLSEIKGCSLKWDGPIFNEFVVQFKDKLGPLFEKAKKREIHPGIDLGILYPELKNSLLICATETKTKEELDALVTLIQDYVKEK